MCFIISIAWKVVKLQNSAVCFQRYVQYFVLYKWQKMVSSKLFLFNTKESGLHSSYINISWSHSQLLSIAFSSLLCLGCVGSTLPYLQIFLWLHILYSVPDSWFFCRFSDTIFSRILSLSNDEIVRAACWSLQPCMVRVCVCLSTARDSGTTDWI